MSDKAIVASGRTDTTSTDSDGRQTMAQACMSRKASRVLDGAPSALETPRTGAVPCNFPCKSMPTTAPAYRPTPAQRLLLSALSRGRYPLRTAERTVAACEALGWLRRDAPVGLLVLTDAGRAVLAAPIAGDWVDTIRAPHGQGIVLRVSRDGGWADVRWRDGGTTWVKRMPLGSLRVVTMLLVHDGTVTDVTREAELAAAAGEARG